MYVGIIEVSPMPDMEDVFCPYVGWTISRDGCCYDCGASHNAKDERN